MIDLCRSVAYKYVMMEDDDERAKEEGIRRKRKGI
jgi:hypothetical protein